MTLRGYTDVVAVQDELGITLTGDQCIHAERLILEAESYIDGATGQAWGTSGVMTAERHIVTNRAIYVARTPVVSIEEIRFQWHAPWVVTQDILVDSSLYRIGDASTGLIEILDWLVPNVLIGTLTVEGNAALVSYSYTADIPPLVSRAARLLVAHWLQPATSQMADDIQSYSVGGELTVTRFDRPDTYRGIPSSVQDLIDQIKGVRLFA